MNLEHLGVQEMNAKELTTIDGGHILPTSYGQYNNSLVYAAQAIYNGFAAFCNFALDCWATAGSGGQSPNCVD